MTVLINEERLAFLRIGLPQVKVKVSEFAEARKRSPDLQNLIEIPTYEYLLNTVPR